MAEVKTNAMRILEKNKVPYKMYTYENDGNIDGVSVAKKLGQDVEAVYKTLVTVGKSGKNYVFVVPSSKELDLKKALFPCGHEKALSHLYKRHRPGQGDNNRKRGKDRLSGRGFPGGSVKGSKGEIRRHHNGLRNISFPA